MAWRQEEHYEAQLMFLTALTCTSAHAHATRLQRWKMNAHFVQITARNVCRHSGEESTESNEKGWQNQGNERPFLPQRRKSARGFSCSAATGLLWKQN